MSKINKVGYVSQLVNELKPTRAGDASVVQVHPYSLRLSSKTNGDEKLSCVGLYSLF